MQIISFAHALALVANGLFDIFASPVYTISMACFANRVAITDLANRTSLVLFFVLAYLFSWLILGLESWAGG